MKTHYCPSPHEEDEQAACGIWLGEGSGLSGDWSRVDCQRCVKARERISRASDAEERAIVEQMGDWASFMREQQSHGAQP